jgi:hypothetical protein
MVRDLGLKSDPNLHRAHGGPFRVRIEARQRVVAAANFQIAGLPTDQRPKMVTESRDRQARCHGRGTCVLLTRLEKPAAARKLISPFSVSPSGGKPGREGSPHAGKHAARQQKALARSDAAGSPQQEGCRPLVDPPLTLGTFQKPAGEDSATKTIKDGRHVGLDFYDLLIEPLMPTNREQKD